MPTSASLLRLSDIRSILLRAPGFFIISLIGWILGIWAVKTSLLQSSNNFYITIFILNTVVYLIMACFFEILDQLLWADKLASTFAQYRVKTRCPIKFYTMLLVVLRNHIAGKFLRT